MSKAIKSVGNAVTKVFKTVTNTVKKVTKSKVGKALLAAAAIYFTGGLAAGSFAPSAVGAQLTSWVSTGANAVGNFANSLFGGGGAAAAGTTATSAATGATTAASGLGAAGTEAIFAAGAPSTLGSVAAAAAPAAPAAVANPSIFSQALTGFSKLPATTQLMVGNAAMQGFGAVAQARQQQAMIDEQRRQEEARKGNYTPVALEPYRPQSIYSRVGG
ncbi:MAG: hypothetical protein ING61_16165 [Rhodocyclaceae bacterium]|nr:hypothetical protein [Rhodocyclaceae bacterium]